MWFWAYSSHIILRRVKRPLLLLFQEKISIAVTTFVLVQDIFTSGHVISLNTLGMHTHMFAYFWRCVSEIISLISKITVCLHVVGRQPSAVRCKGELLPSGHNKEVLHKAQFFLKSHLIFAHLLTKLVFLCISKTYYLLIKSRQRSLSYARLI
jgi:hypothetical protein